LCRKSYYTDPSVTAPGVILSAQDPSGLPVNDEASYSTNESNEVPKKKRSLLKVPSRSSSQKIQPSPTTTGLSGATIGDPTDSIGRRSKESRSSIMDRRRNGSATSSKRSGTAPGAMHSNAGNMNTVTSVSAPAQKSKKSRGLLGFLNCCGVPDNANGMDSEDIPLAPKKVTTVPSQNVPLTSTKPESSTQQAGGSRTTVLPIEKEDLRPTEPGQAPASGEEEVPKTSAIAKQDTPQVAVERIASDKDGQNQPLSTLAQDAGKAPRDQDGNPSPSVVVQAPPVIQTEPDGSTAIPSQTDAQVDSQKDTIMPDAPPISTEEAKPQSADQHEALPAVNTATLPPPPPLPVPDPIKSSTNPPQDLVSAAPVEEKQQWLLPPMEARFKGKKCLVLDLDETLVHSSFKVRILFQSAVASLLTAFSDTPSGGLYDTC
jgi:RNA polymerase II subunit A small phosphatase-like protein